MQELRVWGNKTGGETKGAMWKKLGKCWNVWGCGVRVCIILYILLYIIILLWGLGGGDGSATPSEQMAAVLEFGNTPPCE